MDVTGCSLEVTLIQTQQLLGKPSRLALEGKWKDNVTFLYCVK